MYKDTSLTAGQRPGCLLIVSTAEVPASAVHHLSLPEGDADTSRGTGMQPTATADGARRPG